MYYEEFTINLVKETLLERSMKDSCPKKYSVPMFEAYEIIKQLQKELLEIKAAEERNKLGVKPVELQDGKIQFVQERENGLNALPEIDSVTLQRWWARRPISEGEVQEQGCEYCEGTSKLYQHTTHTNLFLNTFGKARTLVVECYPCPPYADCSHKGTPARSAFLIKFCPECGRRLEGVE